MAMEKAKIIDMEKGGKAIDVMYNPPSLKITSSNTYADAKTPGKNQEQTSFLGNNNDILTVELFFDTTRKDKALTDLLGGSADVRKLVNPILELSKVPKDKANKEGAEPPKLVFAWGSYTFDCVIVSIDHTYDYFNSAGEAQRATLGIKFRRIEPSEAANKLKEKAQMTTVVKEVVKAGQDVTSFTEDPTDWRSVAELNDLDNPNLLAMGMMVGEMLITQVVKK
ncbi:MAG: hypothetical protein FWF83_01365 [Clostridiales bacterium]|nr:hypothetical protein [Clostridiales bacterium]